MQFFPRNNQHKCVNICLEWKKTQTHPHKWTKLQKNYAYNGRGCTLFALPQTYLKDESRAARLRNCAMQFGTACHHLAFSPACKMHMHYMPAVSLVCVFCGMLLRKCICITPGVCRIVRVWLRAEYVRRTFNRFAGFFCLRNRAQCCAQENIASTHNTQTTFPFSFCYSGLWIARRVCIQYRASGWWFSSAFLQAAFNRNALQRS